MIAAVDGGLLMSIVASPPRYTIDEFLRLPDHKNFELVDGELEEINVSNLSALVASDLIVVLASHCKPKRLGRVFPSDAYYQCFPEQPGHARKPDVSFIREERLPAGWLEDGYFTIPPDLAVEVISPGDSAYKVDEKIGEYLDAGVKLVWRINPELRVVLVHRADGTVAKLKESDTLSGENVIEGFSCPVAAIFPPRAAK
jgi:Uma2 family endonuclease